MALLSFHLRVISNCNSIEWCSSLTLTTFRRLMETSTLALVISFPVMSSEEIGGILLLNPSSRRRIWHSYSSDLSLQLGSWLHLSSIRIHWPTLQVNSPFCWHPVSFISRVIWSPEQPGRGQSSGASQETKQSLPLGHPSRSNWYPKQSPTMMTVFGSRGDCLRVYHWGLM